MDVLKNLKVILFGETSVGKTSIIDRFVNDTFQEDTRPTCKMSTKYVQSNCGTIRFRIWDAAGQMCDRSSSSLFMRGSDIVYLVYDVTHPSSFEKLSDWLEDIQEDNDNYSKSKIVLVGNKSDLQAEVDDEIALEFAQENNLQFVKTSARTGENIYTLFTTIGYNVIHQGTQPPREMPMIDIKTMQPKDEKTTRKKKKKLFYWLYKKDSSK